MFGLKIFFVVNLCMALSFDPKGLLRLHHLSNMKKGVAIDPIEKDDISMDTEDLGGQTAELEAAIADMQQSGENTELLIEDVVNPMSNQAFQSPVFVDQPEYEALGPGYGGFPSVDDGLVTELIQNNAAVSEGIPQEQRKQRTLDEAISEANTLFSDAGMLSDQTEFMRRMAATESNYGKAKLGDYSYGAFQIDPIKYRDFVERSEGGAAGERADLANQYLREQFEDENFDIRNLFDSVSSERGEQYVPNAELRAHDPLVGAVLARLGLGNIRESIPSDLKGQAKYWKDHWNTAAGKGTEQKFIKQAMWHGFGEPTNIKGMTGP